MIKLEHTVFPSTEEMDFIIEGMRNPMNSWDNSDSYIFDGGFDGEEAVFSLGEEDERLMLKLAKAGTDHRKYLRMMPVYVRVTAPLYWWKEFTWDDFSVDHLKRVRECSLGDVGPTLVMESIINGLNYWRRKYLKSKSKDDWWQMIQLLPSSYNQTRNVMLNYEVLANIYASRQGHKLDEWREFCKWIKTLPYSDLILAAAGIKEGEKNNDIT